MFSMFSKYTECVISYLFHSQYITLQVSSHSGEHLQVIHISCNDTSAKHIVTFIYFQTLYDIWYYFIIFGTT